MAQNGTKIGKAKPAPASSVRKMAAGFGIPGAATGPIEEVRRLLNNRLAGTWSR